MWVYNCDMSTPSQFMFLTVDTMSLSCLTFHVIFHTSLLVCVWSVYGQCMVCVWSMYGQCMVSVWSVYGQCMVCVWSVTVSVWSVYDFTKTR